MDIKWMRSFIEIVENGSITAAAKKLYIAQPALSGQLKAMETELGACLLRRTSRRQELTDAGRLFYEKAKLMVSLEDSLHNELADQTQGTTGVLRIGLTYTIAITMLDHLLLEYGRLHRDFRYEFYETQSFEILDLLESGVVDLGIVRTPCHISRQMEVRYFPSEPMVAVFDPVRFPQLQGEGPLELEKLEHLPLCIIRRYEDIFRKSCGDRGVTPHIACSSFQMSVSLVWAQNALGVGLIPLSALGCVEDTRLCHRTLGDPQLETRRVLLYMKKTELPEPAAGFLEFCKAQHAIEEKAPLS